MKLWLFSVCVAVAAIAASSALDADLPLYGWIAIGSLMLIGMIEMHEE